MRYRRLLYGRLLHRRLTWRSRVGESARVAYPRQLEFDGMVNFRDLGGLPAGGGSIRPGRLYRSDSVVYASAADVTRLVDDLGLATLIDLRGEREIEMLGRGPMQATVVSYVSAPIADVTAYDSVPEHYVAILDERGDLLVTLLRRLAEPAALPALIHCEAGCDRTGVVSAILLALLGVPDDEICADYAQTAAAVPAINTRAGVIAQKYGLPAPDGYSENTFMPTVEVMAETLRGMRGRWGDAAGWATAHGLKPAEIEALRGALVD
jgi:protein tyrosine/serine phosphatase